MIRCKDVNESGCTVTFTRCGTSRYEKEHGIESDFKNILFIVTLPKLKNVFVPNERV